MTTLNMNIAIIGGSIAGCSAAILLKRLGAKVTIYERSAHPLEGRGAGVVLPEALIQQCIDLNLFDADIPRLKILNRCFIVKDNHLHNKSKKIWEQPFLVSAVNWGDVYQNLRKRISNDDYHSGEAIIKVDNTENSCQIETISQKNCEVDMIIAADGIDSITRNQLLPSVQPNYVNYIAWRGVIDKPAFVEQNIFAENVPYYVYPKGHILFYCIPSPDFKETGQKFLNWVMYEDCTGLSLKSLLIDNKGMQRTFSLPPGSLTLDHLNHLHTLSLQSLPLEVATIVNQTEKPFMQAVFDLQVPSYVQDRVCFIGDAATVLRPHSASGTVKALKDSIRLAETLAKAQSDDFITQLAEWNQAQLVIASEEAFLAKNMGEGLVTNTPDWSAMNDESMNVWWSKVMSGKKWYATDF